MAVAVRESDSVRQSSSVVAVAASDCVSASDSGFKVAVVETILV